MSRVQPPLFRWYEWLGLAVGLLALAALSLWLWVEFIRWAAQT